MMCVKIKVIWCIFRSNVFELHISFCVHISISYTYIHMWDVCVICIFFFGLSVLCVWGIRVYICIVIRFRYIWGSQYSHIVESHIINIIYSLTHKHIIFCFKNNSNKILYVCLNLLYITFYYIWFCMILCLHYNICVFVSFLFFCIFFKVLLFEFCDFAKVRVWEF